MAGTHSKSFIKDFLYGIYKNYIPNPSDKPRQIIVKILLIISTLTLIVSSCYLSSYFATSKKQQTIIEETREIWYASDTLPENRFEKIIAQNSDFKAWLTISGTKIDNPVFQTTDDEFYLDHNQEKKSSKHGALFFSADDNVDDKRDKNYVIYGHNMKDESMFGTLRWLRNLNFYKENPYINLSTVKEDSRYIIYAVFILNADPKDDNNYIYNIGRSDFDSSDDFDKWTDEAFERSLINTGVDVKFGDDILTLVSCTYEIEDARIVVMARKLRSNEGGSYDVSYATVNASPRYPKRWYDDRKIKFPY